MHTKTVHILLAAMSAGLLLHSEALALQTQPPAHSVNTTSAGPDPFDEKLGVNCRGSWGCEHFNPSGVNGKGNTRVIDYITHAIDGIDPNRIYHDGEHIACQPGSYHYCIVFHCSEIEGGICAFLQNTHRDITGKEIQDHAHGLVNHGCKACGSQPTEGGNNVRDGQLTLNFVSDAALKCDGLC